MAKPFYSKRPFESRAERELRQRAYEEGINYDRDFRKSQYMKARRVVKEYGPGFKPELPSNFEKLQRQREENQLYFNWTPVIENGRVKLVKKMKPIIKPIPPSDWMVFDGGYDGNATTITYQNDAGEKTDGKGNVLGPKRKVVREKLSPNELSKVLFATHHARNEYKKGMAQRKAIAKAKLLKKYPNGFLPSWDNSLKKGQTYNRRTKKWEKDYY